MFLMYMPCRTTTGCTRAHADAQLSLSSLSPPPSPDTGSNRFLEKKQPKKLEKKRAASVDSFSL
jgi:hypothetical protein